MTLESAGDVGPAAKAGGTLALHGGGGHHVTGGQVQHHPSGGGAPGVSAPQVPAKASAFAKPAGPSKGRLTHDADRVAKAAAPGPKRVARQTGDQAAKAAAHPATRLNCAQVWADAQARTHAILATGGGPDGDADPIKRNRAISRAYAELYQAKPNLE